MINFDRFLASFINEMEKYQPISCYYLPACIKKALEDQGLEYKDGKIVKTQLRGSAEAKENDYGESEDDTIRRIINCLKGNMPDNHYRKECIAWLEMQGQKPIVNYMK